MYHVKKVYSKSGRVGYEVTKGKGIFKEYVGEWPTRQEAREHIKKLEHRMG